MENIKELKNKLVFRENTLDEYIFNEIFVSECYFKKITLTKDDVWLDAGANIGLFSLSIFDRVKKIIAFEPDNENFSICINTQNKFNMNNVQFVKKAIVHNTDKTRDFYLNGLKNRGSHTLIKTRGRDLIVVECENINNIIKNNNVNKIKMDIEGAEYEVLKVIDCWNQIDEIILEFHFSALKDHPKKEKYFEVLSILKQHFNNVVFVEDVKKNWTTVIYANKRK